MSPAFFHRGNGIESKGLHPQAACTHFIVWWCKPEAFFFFFHSKPEIPWLGTGLQGFSTFKDHSVINVWKVSLKKHSVNKYLLYICQQFCARYFKAHVHTHKYTYTYIYIFLIASAPKNLLISMWGHGAGGVVQKNTKSFLL